MSNRPHRIRLAALVCAPLLLLAACGDDGGSSADSGTTASESPSATTSPSAADGECSYPTDAQQPSKDVDPPPAEPTTTTSARAILKTSAGAIRINLDAEHAPCTVNSFLSLAEQDFFDDTSCHRLTTQGIYVLQCGDPTGTGSGGPGYSFADELLDDDPRIQPCQEQDTQQGPTDVCTYGPGTVAMANAGPDTNGSQFFLVYDNSPLPAAYTVFGRMDAAGLKVVQKVADAGIGTPGMGPDDGAPKTEVKITDVSVR